ncbi:hypothetical protein [Actinomadura napierensis]|uniref:Uncharacterized protein n=1 Tax=Actinomadura napierensis TaxID=267854 RepID=A0ABP5L810_9ACTN
MRLAYAPASEERDIAREKAETKWARESKGRENKKPTYPMKEAAIDTSIADLVDWLAVTISIADKVQALGHSLTGNAMGQLKAELEVDQLEAFKAASVNHFWCELLACLACTIDSFGKLSDQLNERLSRTMIASKYGEAIPDNVILCAIQATLNAIPAALPLPHPNNVDHVLWPLRILAILMCKAPERHEAVSRCCLDPIAAGTDELVKSAIADATKERLVQVLPPDWLPTTRSALFD